MPFWNPERQERVRNRIFKIKVILEDVSKILKLAGMLIAGIGITFFIFQFLGAGVSGGSIDFMVWGFGMYLGGYMLRRILAELFHEVDYS